MNKKESEEKGPEAMSNIICRTESDSLNTQQWYKRNKAEEDMATKAVILVGGPGKVIFDSNMVILGSKFVRNGVKRPKNLEITAHRAYLLVQMLAT